MRSDTMLQRREVIWVCSWSPIFTSLPLASFLLCSNLFPFKQRDENGFTVVVVGRFMHTSSPIQREQDMISCVQFKRPKSVDTQNTPHIFLALDPILDRIKWPIISQLPHLYIWPHPTFGAFRDTANRFYINSQSGRELFKYRQRSLASRPPACRARAHYDGTTAFERFDL